MPSLTAPFSQRKTGNRIEVPNTKSQSLSWQSAAIANCLGYLARVWTIIYQHDEQNTHKNAGFEPAYLSYESRYSSSVDVVAFTEGSLSIASIHLAHLLPSVGSGHARYGLSTRLSRSIQGANWTSTKPMSLPRKNGPSGSAAVINFWISSWNSDAWETCFSLSCSWR